MSEKSAIALAISEIRGDMTDREFADALGDYTEKKFRPSPTTIQKYRTGLREPSYSDLQIILQYGRAKERISPITAQRLADFFSLTELRGDFVQLQHDLYTLHCQLAGQQPAPEQAPAKKTIPGKRPATSATPNPADTQPLSRSFDLIRVPIIVQIPANYPHNLEQNCEGYVTMPRHMLQGDNYFFLKVFGDSLWDFGIEDGDLIMVRQSDTAEDGQSIVARVKDQDIYCKKYFHTASGVILLPADRDFQPIPWEDIRIIGIIEKVTRNL